MKDRIVQYSFRITFISLALMAILGVVAAAAFVYVLWRTALGI